MTRRFPLRPGPPSGRRFEQTIILPPLAPPAPAGCPACPECSLVPALAQWTDITDVMLCTPYQPDQATITDGLFVASPGVDTDTTYEWTIELQDWDGLPRLCCVVPAANFEAQLRGANFDGFAISDPTEGEMISPYFLIRGDEGGGGPPRFAADQRGGGLTEATSFRILCIPIDPA